jgi:hypothetical protein
MLINDVNPKTLSRLELLKLAQTLNVSDADVMTRAELRAAIERARKPEPRLPPQPATWLGVARRLLASVVERGLHLPDAAAVIRGDASLRPMPSGPPPVATVTLARIYAAQGHLERGIATLDEVLDSDPDHDLARELRAQLAIALAARRHEEQLSSGALGGGPPRAKPAEEDALPPHEFEFAAEESSPASDLLGAVPLTDVPLTDVPLADVPLAGDAGLAEEFSFDAGSAELMGEAAAELESIEPVPETRRDSGKPPAPTLEAAPEPVAAAEAAPAAEPSPPSLPLPASAEVPASAPLEPRPAGLALIETSGHTRYLYWELARPSTNGTSAEPHWISVVAYTPRGAGSERSEKRFPVIHGNGAVRLEGLSPLAVVRAKLSRSDADAVPLVVAGSIWSRDPAELAARAADHLAEAAPIYC